MSIVFELAVAVIILLGPGPGSTFTIVVGVHVAMSVMLSVASIVKRAAFGMSGARRQALSSKEGQLPPRLWFAACLFVSCRPSISVLSCAHQ